MGVVHNAVIGTLLLVLLAALGYLLTTEMDGMAPYERLTWRLRGLVRGAVQGRIITPDDLPGVVVSSQSIPITWAGSFVQPAPDPGQAPGLAVHPPSRPRPTLGGGTSAKEPAHAAL